MEASELVKIARALGAKVKTIKRQCQHQVVGQNVFEYCPEDKQREFGINLGSAGGPAIMCKGHSLATGGSHKEGNIIVIEYSEPKTCPFYLEKGEIIGWEIFLPTGGKRGKD